MPHDLTPRLVIAVASSALFDLRESDRIYREEGLPAYRKHQIEREEEILPKGSAFAFVGGCSGSMPSHRSSSR